MKKTSPWFWIVLLLLLLVVFVYSLARLGKAVFSALGEAFTSFAYEGVNYYFLQTLVIGLITMALIQVARYVYPIRGRFHYRWVGRWLDEGVRMAVTGSRDAKSGSLREETERARDTLQELAVTSRRRELLFDLPLDQLCGQISAAAEEVLNRPVARDEMKSASTGPREKLLWGLAGQEGAAAAREYPQKWMKNKGTEVKSGRNGELTKEQAEFLRLRDELSQHIQRNIDGLQIWAGRTWRRLLRITAILVSLAIATALATGTRPPNGPELNLLERAFAVLFTGLLGGFFATVARDVLAVVERYRR